MSTRGPQLRTVADVAAFLGKVTREVYLDKIDIKKASTIGYLCAQLRGCLESASLEGRIAVLEEQLSQQRNGNTVRPLVLAATDKE